MKITKSEIAQVVRDQAMKSAVEGASEFPTTPAHWEEFKKKLEEGGSGARAAEQSAAPGAPSFFSVARLSTALGALAAIALLFVVLTPQKALRFSEAQGFRGGAPNTPGPAGPGPLSGLRPEGAWKVALDFDRLSIALPLADGSALRGALKPAPELNTAEDPALRYFRIVDLSATLSGGRTLSASGTLQVRVEGLPAAIAAPRRLRDVQSATLKLDLPVEGGRTQELWYEFAR